MKRALFVAAILFLTNLVFSQVPVDLAKDQQALLKSPDPKLAANKKIAFDFFREVLEATDMSKVDRYMTEDFIEHNPLVPTGRKGFVDHYKNSWKPVPPKATLDDLVTIIAERDLVSFFFRQVKDDPKRPGKKYTTTWYDMFRVTNGKISEHWDYGTL